MKWSYLLCERVSRFFKKWRVYICSDIDRSNIKFINSNYGIVVGADTWRHKCIIGEGNFIYLLKEQLNSDCACNQFKFEY